MDWTGYSSEKLVQKQLRCVPSFIKWRVVTQPHGQSIVRQALRLLLLLNTIMIVMGQPHGRPCLFLVYDDGSGGSRCAVHTLGPAWTHGTTAYARPERTSVWLESSSRRAGCWFGAATTCFTVRSRNDQYVKDRNAKGRGGRCRV
jgi:hypothetical protein